MTRIPSKAQLKAQQKPTFLMVRIDPKDRAKFARVCEKAGSTMSSSIRTFIDIRIGKALK